MKRLLMAFVLLAYAGHVWGQMPPLSTKQVDKSEILRWGNRVVESGTGIQSGHQMLFTAAMAPPEDDSDQWFITVFSMDKCPACEKLVKDFQDDKLPLAAFVASPATGKRPWAHFNVYKHGDPFQKKRFEDYKVERGPFPIIIIQPPRNARFGPPALVVDRIEARDSADPVGLHKRIVKVVELYVKKLHDSGYQPPQHVLNSKAPASPLSAGEAVENSGGRSSAEIITQQWKGYAIESGEIPIPPPNPDAIGQTVPNKPVAPEASSVIGGPWGPDPPAPTPFNPAYPNNYQPAGPPGPNVSGGDWDFTGPRMATMYLMLLAGLKAVELIGPRFGWDIGFLGGLRKFLESLTTPVPVAMTAGSLPPPTVINQTGPSDPPPPGYLLNSEGQLIREPASPVRSSRTKSR